MDPLKPRKSLKLDGNLLYSWRLWKQEFILYMTATEYNEKPNEVKASCTLYW